MSFAGFLLFLATTALCAVCVLAIKPKTGDDEHHGHGHGGHH